MNAPHPLAKELTYVPLSPQWLEALAELERESYADPWSLNMFSQELLNGASHFFLAIRDHQLIGYAGYWLVLDEAHVTKVTVAKSHRGLGLGGAILEHLLSEARSLGATVVRLEVRESNAVARSLYRKAGFAEVRIRRGYYARSQEDAIEMALSWPVAEEEGG